MLYGMDVLFAVTGSGNCYLLSVIIISVNIALLQNYMRYLYSQVN